MTKAPSTSKRLLLINRDFQLRYTRMAVLVGFTSTCLTIFLILFPLFQFQIVRFPNFLPVPFLWGIAAAALLNFLFVACFGVLFTHRIAGPMFSLVRHFHMVKAGYLTPHLRIRNGDDLRYLVRNFNELLDHLHSVTGRDLAVVDEALTGLRAGNGDDATRKLDLLRETLARRLEPPPPAATDAAARNEEQKS